MTSTTRPSSSHEFLVKELIKITRRRRVEERVRGQVEEGTSGHSSRVAGVNCRFCPHVTDFTVRAWEDGGVS